MEKTVGECIRKSSIEECMKTKCQLKSFIPAGRFIHFFADINNRTPWLLSFKNDH